MLGELLPQGGDVLAALILLNKQVLQPLVLSFQLGHLVLKGRDLVIHLLGRFLQSLLTLLLLYPEASASGCVTPSLVLLGGNARRILKVQRLAGGGGSGDSFRLSLLTGLRVVLAELGLLMGNLNCGVVGLQGLESLRAIGEAVHGGSRIGVVEVCEVEVPYLVALVSQACLTRDDMLSSEE